MTIVAIDPGASGGIAWHDGETVQCAKMPDTISDLCDLLMDLLLQSPEFRVVLERVGFHVKGNSASASCKFARHCGQIEGALAGMNISFSDVAPQRWMKSLGALPKDKADRKRRIKEIVQSRYPYLKITNATADALGILAYALTQDRRAA